MEHTKEMTDFFFDRTHRHVDLVIKWYSRCMEYLDYEKRKYVHIYEHDESKFNYPEFLPYVHITWYYKNKDYVLDEETKELVAEATFHHIKSNKHHPEYWDNNFNEDVFNKQNRDDIPNQIVDATGMPIEYVIEMTADWFAVAEEKGTDPYEWASFTIDKRWNFNIKQKAVIYDLMNNVWKPWSEK